MKSPQEKDGAPAGVGGDVTYPEDGEVLGGPEATDPAGHTQPNPDFVTSKKLKDEEEKGRIESRDGLQKLKSTLVISGVVVAVIGAICAIAKKIKEA